MILSDKVVRKNPKLKVVPRNQACMLYSWKDETRLNPKKKNT
jgi:hypothetical protein